MFTKVLATITRYPRLMCAKLITHLKRRALCLRLKHLNSNVPTLPLRPDDQPIRPLADNLKFEAEMFVTNNYIQHFILDI